jgi:predicted DNA-binding transcriptional regulator YafY
MDLRICHAIAERTLLMFGYAGVVRVVEPHLYGVTTAGHEALSAWMRPGWSRQDPEGGWRMFRLDAVTDLQALPERFDAPRPDFNPDDPHFVEVFCRAAPPPPVPDAPA